MTDEIIKYRCPILNLATRQVGLKEIEAIVKYADGKIDGVICPCYTSWECLAAKKEISDDWSIFNDTVKSKKCILKKGFEELL